MATRSGKPPGIWQLAKESSLYVLGNVIRRGFSLITMPVFTRYLAPSGYGIISIVGSVQSMLEMFYELGLASASTRFYYDCKSQDQRQRLFGTLLVLSLGVTLALTLLLFAVGPWLWSALNQEVPFFPYLALTIGTVFLGNVGILPRVLFRVQNRVPTFFRLSVVQMALTVLLSVALVVGAGYGPTGPILATFVATAIFSVVYAHYLRPHVRLTLDWPAARQALRFGLPTIPTHLIGGALRVVDRLILQRYTSLAVVGIYSVGASVGKAPFDLVGNGIHWAIQPFFYATATQGSEPRSKATLARVATYNVAVLAGLGLATVLFGQDLIRLLASARYLDAASILPVIVVGAFVRALSFIPVKGIYLRGKTGRLPLISVAGAVVNVAMNLLLIPAVGMIGAAWASLAGSVTTVIAIVVVSQRVYPLPYEYGRMAKVVLTACAVAWIASLLSADDLIWRLVEKSFAFALFPITLWLVGFFADQELLWIRARLTAAVQGRA